MLHAGLDLSRRRLDVCLIGDDGDVVGRLAAPPDALMGCATWSSASGHKATCGV